MSEISMVLLGIYLQLATTNNNVHAKQLKKPSKRKEGGRREVHQSGYVWLCERRFSKSSCRCFLLLGGFTPCHAPGRQETGQSNSSNSNNSMHV